MVRAKVRCDGIFSTVYETDAQKSDENVRFTQATPWGQIKLGIDNPKALSAFEKDKYYYVDFTEAPAV